MHPTTTRLIRAIPLSTIPASYLRLPPKAPLRRPSQASSPTIDRLLNSVAKRSTPAAEGPAANKAELLPPNLRIVEYVPKRREYEGVKASHRDLLRRLRREA
ncbi:hypothetical protein JCM11251_002719 [Rhodosporidiobolus azoricus]